VQDDQDTPSRTIIAELMILSNCLAARFCRDNNIPVLFRTQAEPSERLAEDESGYVYYVFKQRRKLSPAYIETVQPVPTADWVLMPICRYLHPFAGILIWCFSVRSGTF